LTHDKKDHVIPIQADLLVGGNTIAGIERSINVDGLVSVIDCTKRILSPGFIDTHRHLWQTQLNDRHGNESLLGYIYNDS